jgi:hypothetical protein
MPALQVVRYQQTQGMFVVLLQQTNIVSFFIEGRLLSKN